MGPREEMCLTVLPCRSSRRTCPATCNPQARAPARARPRPPVSLGAFYPAPMTVCLKTSHWWGRPENPACIPAGRRPLGPARLAACTPCLVGIKHINWTVGCSCLPGGHGVWHSGVQRAAAPSISAVWPSVKPGVLLGAGTGVDCVPNRTQLLGSLCCNHNQHPRGTHQGVWETGLSTTRVPWASCLVRKAAASGVHHQPGSASWEAPDSLLVPGRWPVALRGRDVSPVWLSHTWHGG